jgi:LysM repeat protein
LVPTPSAVPSRDLAWLVGDVTTPGLTAIVLPTSTPTPPPPSPTVLATPLQHKVKSGESVGLIADDYGVKVKDLVAVNDLSSDGFIYPGQMLKIPGTSMPVPPSVTPTPTGGTLIYTIKSGDTFYGLAEDFNTDVDLILQANKMKITDFLGVGDHILIPLGGDTPQPTPTVTGTPVPPTFTPQVGFYTPALLMPPDASSQVGKDEVLLTWTATGLLANDEWYLVVVRSDGSGKPVAVHWTKGTDWRLTSADRGGNPNPGKYSWAIQVVRGMPDRQDTRPLPLSQPGVPRTFTW